MRHGRYMPDATTCIKKPALQLGDGRRELFEARRTNRAGAP